MALCILITALTMAIEFIAGLATGSLALISDAGHMLSHGFALLISYFAILLAQRPATERRTFGLYRAEILAALINGTTLLLVTALIIWQAYKRLIHPVSISGGWMLVVAVIGFAVNLATALILRSSGEGNLNIRSAFLHMIGDLLSSVVVVIGAAVIMGTDWYWLDPILSVVVCLLILIWAYHLIRESIEILLEAVPAHVDVSKIEERLSRVDGVRSAHDVHVWSITSGLYSMSAHLQVDDMSISRSQSILAAIGEILRKEFNICHYTLQFECGECQSHIVDH